MLFMAHVVLWDSLAHVVLWNSFSFLCLSFISLSLLLFLAMQVACLYGKVHRLVGPPSYSMLNHLSNWKGCK